MSNTTLTDAAVNRGVATDGEPLTKPILIFIMLTLGCAYSFNGLDRSVFPALLSPISKEFGLSLAQGGLLANIFTLNIAIFGALAGWFMARFGRKWTLVGGLLAYSLFTFLIPLAQNYAELAFFRAMTGAGEALHIAAVYSMIGAYFAKNRGTFLGINNSFFGVGTFFGPFLGTHLFAALGSWRPPFYLFGIAGVIIALLVLVYVPNQFTEKVDAEEVVAHSTNAACPSKVINTNTMLCVVSFFLTGYSFLAYMALYSLFLRDSLGYSVVAAGTTFAMYGIGSLTAVFGGWVGERMRRYGLIVCLAIMAGDGYLMFNDVHAMAGQMVLSFVFGAMLSGFLYPRFISVVQRSAQPSHNGIVISMMVPVFYLAGFIAGPVFGELVSVVGWSNAGTISVTLTAGLAAVITCFINPKRMRGV